MGCLATSTVTGNPGSGIARAGSFIGRTVVALILSLSVLPATAAEESTALQGLLALHLTSNHLGAEGYNEENPGLGLRLGRGNWYGALGFYKNSLRRDSVYVGAGKTLARRGPVALNLNGGLVSGYDLPVAPFLIPELALHLGRAQAMVSYFPKIKMDGAKTEHTLALSIGVPF